MTIAMWNFSVCISRSSSATRFDSGTKCAGGGSCRTGSLPSPLAAARDEVLQEHEADDVVGGVVVGGQARLARRDRGRDRFVDGRVGLDRDHVGTRHHHLAHDGVAELEDRVDELALFGLDRRLLRGDVGHREDLVLGDERPTAQPLAGQHDVGEADEAAREHPQRPEAREEHEQTATPASTARSVCCTANVFGTTSKNVNTTMISMTMPTATPAAPKRRFEHRAEQRRADHLRAEHEQQDAVERLLGMFEQPEHAPGALVALFGERAQADPADPRERRLREREHAREDPEHCDDEQHDARSSLRLGARHSGNGIWGTPASTDLSPVPLELAEAREELLLAAPHHRRLVGSAWS